MIRIVDASAAAAGAAAMSAIRSHVNMGYVNMGYVWKKMTFNDMMKFNVLSFCSRFNFIIIIIIICVIADPRNIVDVCMNISGWWWCLMLKLIGIGSQGLSWEGICLRIYDSCTGWLLSKFHVADADPMLLMLSKTFQLLFACTCVTIITIIIDWQMSPNVMKGSI